MATRLRLRFGECEHYGDLDNYVSDIAKCGGKIISKNVDQDEEEGSVVFEVEDKADFMEKFKETESYDFI